MRKIKELKNGKIEVEGVVEETLKGSFYLVKLDNGLKITATVSGRMRTNMIRILPGDKVKVEISHYDISKGIITWNKR